MNVFFSNYCTVNSLITEEDDLIKQKQICTSSKKGSLKILKLAKNKCERILRVPMKILVNPQMVLFSNSYKLLIHWFLHNLKV